MNQVINYKNKLTIGHWNCRSVKNIKQILEYFLFDNSFDVFCLNETKLKDNIQFKVQSYEFIGKNRQGNGGGVGILIKKGIDFEINNSFEKFNREIVSIKLKLFNSTLNVISW